MGGVGGGVKKFNLIVNYTPFIGLKYIFNSYLEEPFKAPVQIIKSNINESIYNN